MRIGLSLLDLAMGGAQTMLVQLAEALAARGHTLRYYLYASRANEQRAIASLLTRLDGAAEPVARPWHLLDCDVIQLDGYHSLPRKLPYLPRFGRCVEIYHSAYSVARSGPFRAPHRVTISHAVQALLPAPSTLIPNGIPLPPLPSEPPDTRWDVALLGRIHPVKQHLLFLEACERLFKRRGSLRALLIGGHPQPGPYQQQVDREIERLRQRGLAIEAPGDLPASEVAVWLQQTRLLLVTSESEGFGRMAVEAMACSLPVVANPVGGLLDIVEEGVTGLFAARDDAGSFAALANGLLDDEARRARMGEAGRARVEAHFSLDAMVDAYERLYREVASGG